MPPELAADSSPPEMDLDEFYRRETKYIKKNENDAELAKTFDAKLSGFKKISSYISGQYDTDEGFIELREHLEKLENERSGGKSPRNRVFYMALPPSVFTVVAKGLKKNVYSESGKNRIIVEKPFGKDLESSREMMTALKAEWAENETYRIDHYLGKEMIKNMLVLRFGNVFLDACMNRNFISNVQITFKEPFGTEGRGGYFDEFGIIRDVCQNRERTRKAPGTDSRPHADAVGAGDGEASVVFRRGHPGRKGASRVPETKLMARSKCCDASHRSTKRTCCWVSMSPRATSRATSMTTLCPRAHTARPSPRWFCGSTTRDGRACLSS